MKRSFILACLLSSAMLLQPLSAAAAYEKEDITLALRAMPSAGTLQDPQRVYVSPSAAAEGTSLHFGIFVEAEYARLDLITLDLVTDSAYLTFVPDSYRNPKTSPAQQASSYTLPDGTVFETVYMPYCLGTLSSQGKYHYSCYSMGSNFMDEQRRFRLTWQYGPSGNAVSFLGGVSDAFSLSEMDAAIAPGTPAGVYHIQFDATDSVKEDENMSRTIVTSNEATDPKKTAYHDLVPGLKNLEIVVAGAQYDGEAAAFRFADETKSASPADLRGTAQRMQDGTLSECAFTDAAFSYAEAPAFPDVVTVPQTSEAALLYDGQPVVTTDGTPVQAAYRIGCRGDVDLDGAVTASDAARILIFAAQQGAGGEAHLADAENEAFAQFLGDVNGDGITPELNASDAAFVLIYAAVNGSGQTPDWQKILHPTNGTAG